MKKLISALLLLLTLSACSHQTKMDTSDKSPQPTSATTIHTVTTSPMSGEQVAAKLTENYRNKASNCGSASTPAFLCSGVILRTTTTSDAFDPWDHSDFSKSTGAVSFAYLRADSKFGKTPWSINNGYILYPIFQAPREKIDPDIECFYPLDGATFYRNEPNQMGCRDSVVSFPYPGASKPCREQNIVTAEQWIAHFNEPAGSLSPNAYSCSFMVTDSLNAEATSAFNQALRVRALVPDIAFRDHNELRIKVWPEHNPAPLPIMAFFYVENGLANAQIDQRKYFDRTGGQIVPVIRLTLPASLAADATFQYFPNEQSVTSRDR